MENTVKNFFESPINFSDSVGNKPATFYKGHVVMVDDATGEVILEKDNLVVLRGRTFALEKMFDIENTISGYEKTNLANKKICLWKAGRGGCVSGEPFNVLAVGPDDRKLGEEIPFMLVKDGEPSPEGYFGAKVADAVDFDTKQTYTAYYAKTFDAMEWITNDEMDEIALKLTLKVNEDDFKTIISHDENGDVIFERNTFINEIGLCIANYNKTTESYSEIELATRLTFESEPYLNNNVLKSATIFYYIYA